MSQLGADDWILSTFKEPGFFLDVGCHDGQRLSNTYKLEKNGWKGICVDPFPTNFEDRPNSIVEKAVVYSEADKEIEFTQVLDGDPGLSGIDENMGRHKDAVKNLKHNIVKLKTSLLCDILDKHNAPNYIDYFNIDIEGSEYEVLSTFDFNKYEFGALSIEHNYEEPKRTMIKDLLESKGYKRFKEVEWDDWYIRDSTQSWGGVILLVITIILLIIFA